MTAEEEPGFLARWSRRKRAVEAAPEAVPQDPPVGAPLDASRSEVEVSPASPQSLACPIPGQPEIDLALLPKIEDLTAGSDVSLFLRPGIPAALRSAALRRMWSLDPAIRDFIGPADYAWDYNDPAGLPPGFSLGLGGNLKQLLAQAIGEIEEPPTAVARPPEGEQRPDPEAADAEAPLPEPDAATPAVARLGVGSPDPDLVPPGTDDPPAPRRRHGGALPV